MATVFSARRTTESLHAVFVVFSLAVNFLQRERNVLQFYRKKWSLNNNLKSPQLLSLFHRFLRNRQPLITLKIKKKHFQHCFIPILIYFTSECGNTPTTKKDDICTQTVGTTVYEIFHIFPHTLRARWRHARITLHRAIYCRRWLCACPWYEEEFKGLFNQL